MKFKTKIPGVEAGLEATVITQLDWGFFGSNRTWIIKIKLGIGYNYGFGMMKNIVKVLDMPHLLWNYEEDPMGSEAEKLHKAVVKKLKKGWKIDKNLENKLRTLISKIQAALQRISEIEDAA